MSMLMFMLQFLFSSSVLICCYFCIVNNIEVGVCKQVQMLETSLVTILKIWSNLKTRTNILHYMPSYVNGVLGLGPFISLVVRWIFFEVWDGFT
jgi:hypothetical protein